ncbi:hypothetical protein [Absidia glauca]|uniref:Uncharacterized protein n=1 Tax=Absidia glauca TaxID=4829 RepID=A0A168NFF6_ABSGL|nr:hypothetical protein [Absidia glauca]
MHGLHHHLGSAIRPNTYASPPPLYTHHYQHPRPSQRPVMQHQRQQLQHYQSWKKKNTATAFHTSPSFSLYQQERPHSDDFLFLPDGNDTPMVPVVAFPPCPCASVASSPTGKVYLCEIQPSTSRPNSIAKPFSSLYRDDPLVTRSKVPLLDSTTIWGNKGRVGAHSTRNTIHHQPPTAACRSSSQSTYYDQPSICQHQHKSYQPQPQQQPHHHQHQHQHHNFYRYPDSTLDDTQFDYRNQRRISTNTNSTDTITITSTSTLSSSLDLAHRRFSGGSTSSRSTLASSMGSISHWNNISSLATATKSTSPNTASSTTMAVSCTTWEDEEMNNRCNSPHDDQSTSTSAQTTALAATTLEDEISIPSNNNGAESLDTTDDPPSFDQVHEDDDQQQQRQTLSSSTADQQQLPIWADPIKVRENPTRYTMVQNYMATHQLSYTSPLPLHTPVIFYFGSITPTTTTTNYRSNLQILFTSATVWEFSSRWRYFKEHYAPLALHQTLYCFQKGVEPMWEDKANQHGGRLTILPTAAMGDDIFHWVMCAFVGGNLVSEGLVGLVFSKRTRADRIELWVGASDLSHERIASLRSKLVNLIPAGYHEPVLASRYKKHYSD